MADSKLTALTEDTSPSSDDNIYLVNDPGGTPTSKKVALSNLLKFVHGLSENTTPATTDELALIDDPSSSPAAQRISLVSMLKVLNELTEDTTPDTAADFLLSYDASASTVKKVLINNATSSRVSDDAYGAGWNGVTGVAPSKNAIYDKIESITGTVIQIAYSQSSAVDTSTTALPVDDTIPTSSEGEELTALNTSITPTSASNILDIEVILYLAPSLTAYMAAALFQDSGAAAIAAAMTTGGTQDYVLPLTIRYRMTAGTTSATTFKIRYGLGGAGTCTVNGYATARKFGGVFFSSMKITEISA